MNTYPETCDPSLIERYLADSLETSRERTFLRHLKSCASCRRRIEQAAVKNLVTPKIQETPTVPNADNEQLKIFNLKNSNAKESADIVTVLYSGPSVRITIDERTNAVIVRADESRLSEIEAVLLRLDEQPSTTEAKSATETIQASGFNLRDDSAASVASELGTSIAEYRVVICRKLRFLYLGHSCPRYWPDSVTLSNGC